MAGAERTINSWFYRIRNRQFKYRWPWNNQFQSDKEYIWYEYHYYPNEPKTTLARAIVNEEKIPILILINDGTGTNSTHVDIVERIAKQHGIPSVKVPFDIMKDMPCYIEYSEYFDGRYERPERPG